MAEEPPGFTSQKGYLGIEKVQIKCFNFSILGWGLRGDAHLKIVTSVPRK